MLSQLLGSVAPTLFAIALIAAGQSSTITGTLAGQIIMEGYLKLRIEPWVRRLLTRLLAIVPAVLVIFYFGEKAIDKLLIFSQVVLSMQLSFAIIPLIYFVSNRKKMGVFTIKRSVQIISWLIAIILIYLNSKMVAEMIVDYWKKDPQWWAKAAIILSIVIYIFLLLIVVATPWVQQQKAKNSHIHPITKIPETFIQPSFKKIAIALGFTAHDEKMLAFALTHYQQNATLILIHIVESASAKILGTTAHDLESRDDEKRLLAYVENLQSRGYNAKGVLGFRNRKKELVRIIKEEGADLLILGAHGHIGIKDILFGTTINSVRHKVQIPVMIVNV